MLNGLGDLFVALPGPDAALELWHAIAKAQPQLSRLVYHQRSMNIKEDSPHFEETIDLLDLSLFPEDRVQLD